MTPHQIDLVQSSFAKISPLGDDAGRIFYGRLFNIAPDVRRLFRGDLEAQAGKLIQMLGVIVTDLKDLDALLPAARALATRHVDYGVEPSHYNAVGEALIWTLADAIGPEFDEEAEMAWRAAYGMLADEMMAAAYNGGMVA